MTKSMLLDYSISCAIDTIKKNQIEHNPIKTIVAYSGGRDSAIVLDIASQIVPRSNLQVMAIDTELACDGWKDMIMRHCSVYGLQPLFVTGDGFDWYADNVLDYGFGYTPNHHTVYYRQLKEKAIYTHLRHTKKAHYDRVLYLTGVRRAESANRRNRPLVIRHGSRVTCNPIAFFSDDEAMAYHKKNLSWYENPYYKTVGSSGDCLCGWTNKNSTHDVIKHHPKIGAKLATLEHNSIELDGWAYNGRPPVTFNDNTDAGMPDDSLCSSCYSKTLFDLY